MSRRIAINKLREIDPVECRKPYLGCDPEFFFAVNDSGSIVGSERVVPVDGLNVGGFMGERHMSKFTLDGVQIELNPCPQSCRAYLGSEIRKCFLDLSRYLNKNHPNITPNFSSVIEIEDEELSSLSPQSREFGCAPSENAYGKTTAIKIDAAKYLYRAGGGHIHITCGSKLRANPELVVPMLDILVGNTCVLLDRDPLMKERRKLYGKAGEYRTPAHGLEYRVLSNFWLRSYPMMSLVMGLTRFCVNAANTSNVFQQLLLDLVNIDDVKKAINENDFDLAWRNFNLVAPFFEEATGDCLGSAYQLTKSFVPIFRYFVDKGMRRWFKHDDVIGYWRDLPANLDAAHRGWEYFLRRVVGGCYDRLSTPKKKEYENGE